jgi:hypothetical protein
VKLELKQAWILLDEALLQHLHGNSKGKQAFTTELPSSVLEELWGFISADLCSTLLLSPTNVLIIGVVILGGTECF